MYTVLLDTLYVSFKDAEGLAESNALACWLCGMLSCFGGKIIANFLLGQPIMAAFSSTKHIIAATVVWYAFHFVLCIVCLLACPPIHLFVPPPFHPILMVPSKKLSMQSEK